MNSLTQNKIFARLQHMIDNDSRLNFTNIRIEKDIFDKLKTYQILHVQNLIDTLTKKRYVIDGSDTGTGKTYSSVAVVKNMNLTPLIICPITIIHTWKCVCKLFNVTPIGIINYEKIKKYGYPPYLKVIDNEYVWNLDKNNVVIFDEAHKCKNSKSLNGEILLSTKSDGNKNNFKVMLLSATISDSPTIFALFGFVMGLYKNIKIGKQSMKYLIREKMKQLDNNWGAQSKSSLNMFLFPDNGSRMELREIMKDESFTNNQISVDCYTISSSNAIFMNDTMNQLSSTGIEKLVEITKLRRKLEKCKVSLLADLTNQYLENNISVVIFMNYIENINLLSKKLGTTNIIYGKQTLLNRQKIIDDFQNNNINIIICNIKCSVGISLHDLHGKQRVSLICPNFSSIDLIQSLGRIYRADLKTPALQRIILCANTYEETIYEKIKQKIDFIDKLNDSDVMMTIKTK